MPRLSSAPAPLPPHLARQIWRGDQLGGAGRGTVSSGYAALDERLPGGGWPLAALSEILSAADGIGEMRLFAPALRAITTDRWQPRQAVLIAPPYMPYAPALAAWGVALERLSWITAPPAEAPWAAVQALKNDGVGIVLAWLPKIRTETLRRLQLAANDGRALAFVLRPVRAAAQSSPAPLRLKCAVAAPAEPRREPVLSIEIFKRRGPPLAAPLLLSLPLLEAAPAWSLDIASGLELDADAVDRRHFAIASA